MRVGEGELSGVEFVVKDCIAIKGYPWRAGSSAVNDDPASRTASALQRLLDAGATLLGSVNQHELGLGVTSLNEAFGIVDNPSVPGHLVGGSSGGTAAAIAAGVVPAGLGTDTGGSTRIPPGLTGTFGFRPSTGRYPLDGVHGAAPTLDTVGPMGESVDMIDRLDAVIMGRPRNVDASIAGTVVAMPMNYFTDGVSDEVAMGITELATRLREVGCSVVECEFPHAEELIEAAHTDIAIPEIAWLFSELAHSQGEDLAQFASRVSSPDVRAMLSALARGEHPTRQAHDLACDVARPKLQSAYADVFAATGAVALLAPCTPITAPARRADFGAQSHEVFAPFIHNPVAASIAGIPSLCVPAPVSGAPVGALLDGPVGSDTALLGFALALEACGVFAS